MEREKLESSVEAARRGEVEAFDTLVRSFQDMAVAYCLSRLGRLDLAQDAAQEAFIVLYGELHSLREPRAFISWFRTILVKQCDRISRRAGFTREVRLEEGHAAIESSALHETVAAALRWEAVLRQLCDLPSDEREVVTLRYMTEMSHHQIAEFIGIPGDQG